MSTQELAMEANREHQAQKRVVELEIKLPKVEELKLPKVDLEPARAVAEQVLLTGLGVGVLLTRGVAYAVKAANRAGVEAAQHPGPIVGALLSLVRRKEPGPKTSAEITRVRVLPIDNYDNLPLTDILARLSQLSAEQLQVLREYEQAHQARPEVLEAINNRLTQG